MPQALPPEVAHLIERLLNRSGFAEGSNLPPPIRGSQRVPFVRSPAVINTQDFLGGTLVNIGWIEPEYTRNISHFNVYAKNVFDGNQSPTLVGSAPRSPASVRVMTDAATPQDVVFFIQTVLANGMSSPVDASPTCTGQIRTAQITEDDLVTGIISGYDIQAIDDTSIDMDAPGTTTLVSENVAGAVLSMGVVILNAPDATCDSRLNVQLDGGVTAEYPILDNGTWHPQLRAENSSLVGDGSTVGDSASIYLGVAYNASAVVSYTQVNAGAGTGATTDIRVFIRFARKT